MAGRGRSSDYDPGTRGSREDQCDISVDAPLQGPRKAILATLNVGEILTVALRETGGTTSVVCREAGNNEVAGALTFVGIATLISCIRQGHTYEAEIVTLDGGDCEVRVYRTGTP